MSWTAFILSVVASLVAAVVFALVVSAPARTWAYGGLGAAASILRLYRVLSTVNLRAFVRSRSDYKLFRGQPRSRISSYVGTARRELRLVGITLTTGVDFEGLCETLRGLLERGDGAPDVHISLLDPRRHELAQAIAPVFEKDATQLQDAIIQTMDRLREFRKSLSTTARAHLSLYYHKAIPSAAAILIDPDDPTGTIQLECKPYKAPWDASFGFELGNGGSHPLYRTLVESFKRLMDDGDKLE